MSIRRIARAFTRLQRLFKPLPGICCLCRHPRIRGLETAVADDFRCGILARHNQPILHICRLQQRMNAAVLPAFVTLLEPLEDVELLMEANRKQRAVERIG